MNVARFSRVGSLVTWRRKEVIFDLSFVHVGSRGKLPIPVCLGEHLHMETYLKGIDRVSKDGRLG